MMTFKTTVINASCFLSMCYISAGAVPVAMSQVSYNLTAESASLGAGKITSSSIISSSYTRSEDMFGVQEQNLTGGGTISTVASGANGSATVNDGSSINTVYATTDFGVATAYSTTSTDLIIYVENADVFNLTLDITASLDLSTDGLNEYSWANWDDYFALYSYDGATQQFLTGDFSYFEWESFDGDEYSINQPATLSLSYNFGATPFTGQLLVQNIAQIQAEAQSFPPTSVPEPSAASMIVVGLAALLPLVRFRKK